MTNRTRLLVAASLATVLCPAMAGAADYVGDASRLIAAGNLPAARLQLRNAVKADASNGAAHYRLGLVDLQLGDPAAAEKEGRAAQDAGYDAHATLSLLTSAYLTQGRSRDLLRDFPADRNDPVAAAVILVARGRAQLQLDHPDQARDSFASARRLAPNAVEPLVAEAQLALAGKDIATAQQKIAEALRLDPNSAEALQQHSEILSQQGNLDGAIVAADKAVAAAPGQSFYQLNRAGVLIAAGRNEAAKGDVDAALAATPNNGRAAYYRAVLRMRAGDFVAANTDLDKLSGFVSQTPSAYLMVAIVKQQVGQAEQALDAATRYVARYPSDPSGALLLAQLQSQAKRPDKVVEILAPLADAGSSDADIYARRAEALAQLGRPQQAVADYQKALTLRPDDPALLATLGAAQMMLHQTDQAAASLTRSLSLAPVQPRTEAMLATALIEAGRLDDAQLSIDRLRAQPIAGGSGGDGDKTEMADMLKGSLALARFNLSVARQAFEAVLHDHPDSVPARLALARVALLQGRPDDWERLTAEVLQREPAREGVVNEAVDHALRRGRPADAIAILERARATAPANFGFTDRLAGIYIATNQSQKAMDLVAQLNQAASTSRPGDASAMPGLLIKAKLQMALKQADAAQTTYRQILAVDPTVTIARVQLSRLLIAANDSAAAQVVLQDGLIADSQNEQLLHMAVEAESKGDPIAALASATTLRRNPVYQPASLVLPGDVLMAAKQYGKAANAYAESIQTAPSARLALRQAVARAAAGEADPAAQGLRDWLAQHPGDVTAEQALSDLEIGAKRFEAAKTLLTAVVTKQPNNAQALNNLAYLYQQTRTPGAALLAQRAYQLAPTPQTADTWGYILATEGGGDHGVGLLRQATQQAPNDPAMQYHLAVAYRSAGQLAEAVKLVTPLVTEPVDFAEKPQARQLLAALSGKS